MPWRVAIDANILIAGLGWPRWPYEVLRHAPLPTKEEVAAYQDLVRQKNDVPITLSIGAARVDYFVTYDRDFTDAGETTEKVRQAIPGIMLPPVFLRDVMGWTSEELETIRNRNWEDL